MYMPQAAIKYIYRMHYARIQERYNALHLEFASIANGNIIMYCHRISHVSLCIPHNQEMQDHVT